MGKLEKNIWNASSFHRICALSTGIIAAALTACGESFTDPRDGQKYDVVQIGDQTWMAENLNYDSAANTNAAASAVTGDTVTAGKNSASFCPDGDKRNCSKFGRLYTWEAAQAACPEGWRLPTRDDLNKLIVAAGATVQASEADAAQTSGKPDASGNSDAVRYKEATPASLVAGKVLKSTSGWFKKGDGSDDLGFAALPAGYMSATESSSDQPVAGKFDGIGGYAYFWSSTTDESEPTFAHYLFLDFSSPDAEIKSFDKNSARSVRCIKAIK